MTQFAKAFRNDRVMSIVAAAFREPEAPEFRIDSKGRKVRVFTASAPLDEKTVAHFYKNNRQVEEDDALEVIGYHGLRYAIQAGHLVPAKVKGAFYVTAKGAAAYGLDRPVLLSGVVADWLA